MTLKKPGIAGRFDADDFGQGFGSAKPRVSLGDVQARTPKPDPIGDALGALKHSIAPVAEAGVAVFPQREDPQNNEPVLLKAEDLGVWEGNPRHVIDPARLQELAQSLKEHGQQEPIDVVRDVENPGRYLILGGQRRWMAVTQFGLLEGMLLARVRKGNPSKEEMLAAAVETQANTEPLRDLDYAISLARSKDNIGVRALSRAIGKSPGEVSKLRQVGLLSSDLLSYMKGHADKFSSLFAYEVVLACQRMGEDRALEFAKTVMDKGLSHKASVSLRETMDGQREPVRRSSWSIMRIQRGGKPAGTMRVREDTGEVTLKVKGLPPESVLALQEVIRKASEDVAN